RAGSAPQRLIGRRRNGCSPPVCGQSNWKNCPGAALAETSPQRTTRWRYSLLTSSLVRTSAGSATTLAAQDSLCGDTLGTMPPSSVRSDIAGDEKSVCTDMKCLMNENRSRPGKTATGSSVGMRVQQEVRTG